MVDLTVVAVPGYFGSIAVENKWLQRRAAIEGASAADYERRDTIANLAMGVGSLIAPFVAGPIRRKVGFPIGRFAKGAAAVTAGAAALTTAADAAARFLERNDPEGEPSARARAARAVGGAAAVTAIGTSVLTAASSIAVAFAPRRAFERRRRAKDRGTGVAALAAATVGWDFIYYWNHRFMHESRFMWAVHVVHHSSERYNLSVALRQPVADLLGTFVPYGLLGYAGIRPELIESARGINLLYQYWIHTDAIGKLGRFEDVFNTPSLHRVHHGSNRRYIDRNHGSILIVWDRLFGTHQVEHDPVRYGLTKNVDSFSPARIATHEYASIARDVYRSRTWSERLSYVFRGPGWAYARHAEAGSPTADEAGEASAAG